MNSHLRQSTRIVAMSVIVALIAVSSAPALAFGLAPSTAIVLDPATPGPAGWYTVSPLVSLVSDQAGSLHWSWDGGTDTSAAVTAGSPYVVGAAPEGEHVVSAYTVNGAGEVESPAVTALVRVDPVAPTQPGSLDATVTLDVGVRLVWDASSDGGSGVSRYAVYRKAGGPPFSPSDIVGYSYDTSYVDVPPVFSGTYTYAVSAWDVAGNESALSELALGFSDFTPPVAPTGLSAWRNASNVALVRWSRAADVGIGVSAYRVLRSIDGGPYVEVGSVDRETSVFTDTGAEVLSAASVDYEVVTVDRLGQVSPAAGPVRMGVDATPPGRVAALSAVPVDAPGWGSNFDVAWAAPSDGGGSGVERVELLYGPSPGDPIVLPVSSGTGVRVGVPTDSALWYFAVRVIDRAGNVSPVYGPIAARHITVDRIAGDATAAAVEVSRRSFSSAHVAVIVGSRAYADALSASSLAGDVHGPVIPVGAGGLRWDVVAELRRLEVRDVYIVGNTAAVSSVTAASIAQTVPGAVTRISGRDAYGVAANVAVTLRNRHTHTLPRAYVVPLANLSGALTAAPASYADLSPIVYANAYAVPSATRSALRAIGTRQSIIVGPYTAVTRRARYYVPGATRIARSDVYTQSRAFANWAVGAGLLGLTKPVVGTGRYPTSSVTAAVLAGEQRSPVILADSGTTVRRSTASWLQSRRWWIERVTLVGSARSLTTTVRRSIRSMVCVP